MRVARLFGEWVESGFKVATTTTGPGLYLFVFSAIPIKSTTDITLFDEWDRNGRRVSNSLFELNYELPRPPGNLSRQLNLNFDLRIRGYSFREISLVHWQLNVYLILIRFHSNARAPRFFDPLPSSLFRSEFIETHSNIYIYIYI